MNSNAEKCYINAFNIMPGIGAQKMHKIFNYFGSCENAWSAPEKELIVAGLSPNLAQKVIESRKEIDVFAAWKICSDNSVDLISFYDTAFPAKLKNITNPPFSLYVRGACEALMKPSVAIVGSRAATTYALQATTMLSQDIASADIAVISGLALGTDACAHKGALETHGTTIAVLGGGIDDNAITPRSHINLAREIIAQGGAIISEYPCGTAPHRGTFPARNRLMAGLSDAVVVIEAAKKSGTLITAEWAQKLHKPLFALPGSIYSQNAFGPHTLIRDHSARILLDSNDVLRVFDRKNKRSKNVTTFSDPIQQKIHALMTKHPDGIHVDQLIKELSLEAHEISSALTLMEIDGHIKNCGNQSYISTNI